MQVHRAGTIKHEHKPAVTALVVSVGAVQRLVKVADEMNEKLQRLRPLFFRPGSIGQHLGKVVDLVDDVVGVLRVAILERGRVDGSTRSRPALLWIRTIPAIAISGYAPTAATMRPGPLLLCPAVP
jgi:hypothetical protein